MRRLTAALLAPLLAVVAALLAGCSPRPAAWVAVAVEDGVVVLVVRTCDTRVLGTPVERDVERAGDDTVTEDRTEIDSDDVARLPTDLRVADLDPAQPYATDADTDDDFAIAEGVRFTVADLGRLGPGEVLAAGRFAPRDEDDESPTYVASARVAENDFIAQAC